VCTSSTRGWASCRAYGLLMSPKGPRCLPSADRLAVVAERSTKPWYHNIVQTFPATPDHHTDIARLNRSAFGSDAESALIACLRGSGLVLAERVALDVGEVVGHILFSRLSVKIDGRPLRAAALAPMAVRPDRQRRGIGSRLVQDGLADMRSSGCQAVIVLGHPDFYPRFGFSADLAVKLVAPFKGETFMALELVPRTLDGHAGSVTYPNAFRIVRKS
jgi:putative acetyltransferase